MLIPKENQADLNVLSQYYTFAHNNKEAQTMTMKVRKQIPTFHINNDAKNNLINIFNEFTNSDNQLQGDHGLNAFHLMVSEILNRYVDDFLVIKNPSDLPTLSFMNNAYNANHYMM